jgi:hypothetical protein
MDVDAVSRTTRRTARAALFAMFAVTLAACHTTRVVWSKPGADQAELQSDLAACQDEAHAAANSNVSEPASSYDIPSATTRQQVSCMLRRGWRLTPLPSS